MAELSLETQAILGRLKAEGDLLRNSGTNSVKSVKIELAKFSGLFESIQTSIDSQVETLRDASGFSREAAEAQQRQNELLEMAGVTEQERAETEKRRFQTEKLKADQDYKDQEDREKARSKNETNFLRKMGGFFSKETFGKIMSGIKFAALAGIGIAVGYQFIAGILEGMGVDVKKFEEGFVEGVNDFIKFLKGVEWQKLGEVFNMLASPEGIATIAGLSALPKITEFASDAAITAAIVSALKGRTRGGTDIPPVDLPDVDGPDRRDPNGRGRGRGIQLRSLLNWRTALLSAVGIGLISYSGEIGEFFKEDAKSISKQDLANTPVNQTSGNENLSIITGAATLGSIFGIKGMIAGAAIGAAYVIGKTLYDTINDEINDLDQLPNEMQKALRNEKIRAGEINVNPRQRVNVSKKTVEEAAAEYLENAQAEVNEINSQIEEALANAGKGNQRDKQNRRIRIKRLRKELELRQQQIQNTEQLLLQRIEQGIADFDIYTPGMQTKAEFEIIQQKRKESLEEFNTKLSNSFESLMKDYKVEGLENPFATQVERTEYVTVPPTIVHIDNSTNPGGTVINTNNSTGGSYVLSASGNDSLGGKQTVFPGAVN